MTEALSPIRKNYEMRLAAKKVPKEIKLRSKSFSESPYLEKVVDSETKKRILRPSYKRTQTLDVGRLTVHNDSLFKRSVTLKRLFVVPEQKAQQR